MPVIVTLIAGAIVTIIAGWAITLFITAAEAVAVTRAELEVVRSHCACIFDKFIKYYSKLFKIVQRVVKLLALQSRCDCFYFVWFDFRANTDCKSHDVLGRPAECIPTVQLTEHTVQVILIASAIAGTLQFIFKTLVLITLLLDASLAICLTFVFFTLV